MKQAEEARAQDRLNDAIGLYRKAVGLRPAWAEGWWYLGTLLYDQDRFPEAGEALERLTALIPKPGPALALLGLCEYETHHFDRALAHLEQWQTAGGAGTPEIRAVARFRLALLLTRAGRFEEAARVLSKKARGEGQSPALIEAAGLAALRMKYLPEEYSPRDRELIYEAGRAALSQSQGADERLQILRGRYVQQPKPPEPGPARAEVGSGVGPRAKLTFEQLSRQAREAAEANRIEEAIALYTDALKLRPEWPEGQWSLSTLLYEKQRYPEARDLQRRFLGADPAAAPGWAVLGLCEFHTREYGRALAHLQRALNLSLAGRESVLWAARYHAGILLTRFERFDEANAVFVEFGAAQRRTDEVIQAMGLAALQFPYLPSEIPSSREEMVRLAGMGAYEVAARHNPEARKHFQELANRYPIEPNARYVFAAFLLADEPETGIAELKRVLELSPGHVPAKVRLAYEYLQRAEVEPALPYAREAVASAPGSFAARLVLGRLLLEKGDVADAVRELEAARQMSPESAPTRWVLATAYARAGREQDATRERAEGERLRKLQKQ